MVTSDRRNILASKKVQSCNCAMTSRGSHFSKVAIGSGHMIDAPDRETPRFPEKAEWWGEDRGATRALGDRRRRPRGLWWSLWSRHLFAEECKRRGARLRLLLAQKVEEFVRDSVRHAGDDWVRRFHVLREQAEVEILPRRRRTRLTTSQFTPGPTFGSSRRHEPRRLTRRGFTRCWFGTRNPPATAQVAPPIFRKICDLGGDARDYQPDQAAMSDSSTTYSAGSSRRKNGMTNERS